VIAPRWLIWVVGVTLLALLALLPLRVALGTADLERLGMTARKVSGTIWNGQVAGLTLNRQGLGNFQVRAEPLPLLLGRASMRFDRIEDGLQGPLSGTLLSGGTARGVKGLTGRLATASLFAPVPVEALDFDQVSIVFRNGRCADASGNLTAVVGTRIGPLDLTRGLSGPVSCEGDRVRARLASAGGSQSLQFTVGEDGRYRAFLTIRGIAPEVAAALTLFGFQPGPDGLTLTTTNQL
jgi:general secretion pathway protein N